MPWFDDQQLKGIGAAAGSASAPGQLPEKRLVQGEHYNTLVRAMAGMPNAGPLGTLLNTRLCTIEIGESPVQDGANYRWTYTATHVKITAAFTTETDTSMFVDGEIETVYNGAEWADPSTERTPTPAGTVIIAWVTTYYDGAENKTVALFAMGGNGDLNGPIDLKTLRIDSTTGDSGWYNVTLVTAFTGADPDAPADIEIDTTGATGTAWAPADADSGVWRFAPGTIVHAVFVELDASDDPVYRIINDATEPPSTTGLYAQSTGTGTWDWDPLTYA
jgi:hypothetical protein